MTKCAAIGCKNTGIHLFPKEIKRRKLWEKALRRKKWISSKSSRLCAAHFKPDDYHVHNSYTGDENLHRVLKKSAVPSKFSFTKIKSANPRAQERSLRLLKRNCLKECFETSCGDPIPGPSGIQNECDTDFSDENVIEIEIPIDPPPLEISECNQPRIKSFESKSTQVNFEHIYGSIERYKDQDSVIAFYTGFETYAKFYFVFSTLSPMAHFIRYHGSNVHNISIENQFFMTMMKLRQNKCNFELAQFFQISTTTVNNIFITWINYMDQLWSKLNIWPEKELVLDYMPESFKQYSKNTRVIINGTEVKIQKPGNPVLKQALLSSYKHNNTLKVLVGATPGGLLSYCSYAGSLSDQQAVETSDLSKNCEPGDSILADSGYNIQDILAGKDNTLNTPTFLKGKGLPGLELPKDRKLASQHVHIKRLIGLTKTYKIVKEELHRNLVPLAPKIYFVCFMCCNFREWNTHKNE